LTKENLGEVGVNTFKATYQGDKKVLLAGCSFMEIRCVIPKWIQKEPAKGDIIQVTPKQYKADGTLNQVEYIV